jgi:hypothetical protein
MTDGIDIQAMNQQVEASGKSGPSTSTIWCC